METNLRFPVLINTMNTKSYFRIFTLLFLFLFLDAGFSRAQTANFAAPKQEKLLNGMNLLVWNDPNAPKVTVKLRIHSGSAFDTQNKEGTMAMLADILFPNDAAKEFFTEDLVGSLEVTSNYDYIQINATANNDQFLTLMETLANAVINPQIDKEITAKARAARLEKLKELDKTPSYIADQAVAKRLFGDFPYGRPQMGTSASVAKIDFADLLLAKQRFLTADNATLAVVGNIKPDLAYRAARRFFGAWTQADKRVPATFAQPSAPDTNFFLIKTEINNASELRFAFRGLSRGEKDFYASRILTAVLQNRLQKKDGNKAVLEQKSYFLPGFMVVKFSDWETHSLKLAADVQLPQNFLNYVRDLLLPNVSPEEFQLAKEKVLREFNRQNSSDLRLDADTFRLAPVKNDSEMAQSATITDVQKILERLRKEAVVKTFLYKASV